MGELSQQPSGGNQYHQLPHQGNDQAVNAAAHCLEQSRGDNAQGGKQEAGADDPQGRDTNVQQFLGRVENAQQPLGEGQEHNHAGGHNDQGDDAAGAEGGHHALFIPCTIVVAQNGEQPLVQTEDRHKHKRLQFEVQAKHRIGSGGERGQDPIEGHGHHRANRLHDNGGHAYNVNVFDDFSVGPEPPEGDVNVVIPEGDYQDCHDHGQDLTGYSGDGSAGYPHGGEAQQAEDHNGVQNNVGDSADQLEDHGPDHIAGGLKSFFQGYFHEHPKGEHTADGNIGAAHLNDFLVCLKEPEKGGGEKRSVNSEQHPGADGQKNTVGGCAVSLFLPALAKSPGDQRGDAHRGTHSEGNQQVLQGERQRYGRQPFFADLGHEVAVHNVVKSLHQHGEHGGQCHGENKGQNGGSTHFVLSRFLRLHTTHPISYSKCKIL